MADKARVQYKATEDPESWQDVDATHPLPVTSGDTTVTNMPPISFEGGGGTETTVSDANPLPVDVIETTDVDDDAIAKSQELPLKIVENYGFNKSNDRWVRLQVSDDGYLFTRPIGMYDAAGHGIDIEATTGAIYSNLKAFRSSDSSYQPLRLDKATNTLQVIDYEHHEIHAGSHFIYYDYDSDVDTASPKYYRLTTPNTTKWIHIVITVYSEGAGTWQLFENPTVNAAGTTATTYNSNRNSVTTPTLVIAYDATSTADGTQLKVWRTGAGTNAASRAGGESRDSLELILKQNEDYFIKFTPDADNAKSKLMLSWYEHTDIA